MSTNNNLNVLILINTLLLVSGMIYITFAVNSYVNHNIDINTILEFTFGFVMILIREYIFYTVINNSIKQIENSVIYRSERLVLFIVAVFFIIIGIWDESRLYILITASILLTIREAMKYDNKETTKISN